MSLKSPFDSRNIIWYISEVTPYNIKIHFPDSKLLKRFNYHWDSLHWWILGSFVAIEWETKWFIWKIVKLSLPEKERMDLSESNYKNKELHPVWIIEILFSFDLLSFEAKKSIQDYPPISSKVYVCSPELYIEILKNNQKEENDELEIWEALWTNEKVNLSANHIFNRHCAILGTTWWWKSYTISKIIEELVKKDNAKIILLDATWEFSKFDTELKNNNWDIISESVIFNNWENSTFFSYKNFVFDDLVALFRPAWQVQLPKLDDVIKTLRLVKIKWSWKILENETIWSILHNWPEIENWILKKKNKSEKLFNRYLYLKSEEINSDLLDIDITKLPFQFAEEFFWVNNEVWGDRENDRDKWNCSSLLLRIWNIINNSEANSIFNFKQNIDESNSLVKRIEDFYLWDKNLFRIDLSNIPETWDIKSILVNSIWRYFLNKSKEKLENDKRIFEDKPIIIFIDEAHLFLNKKVKDEYSIEVELNSFDRIAKECRKFWIFLCLSTQRPRDIPEWVLSQIGTFIVHRLINDKDKQAVENASPSYSKEFLNFLPSLWEWEAIIMWVNFLTTLFLKINTPIIEPNSNTPKLFKN